MLGAVVALRRDGHMRLTTLVAWVRPQPHAHTGQRKRRQEVR